MTPPSDTPTRRPERASLAAPVEVPAANVFLHSGQVFASSERKVISTILGSCVSICLFDLRTRAGGMNHYLLPTHIVASDSNARYGTVAFELLCARLVERGCRLGDCVAKVFGGARVTAVGVGDDGTHLGLRNVDLARDLLAQRGIPIVAADVGGHVGRKLVFDTHSGSAWVRKLGEARDGPQ
jgi:chemotaxis protein CheD